MESTGEGVKVGPISQDRGISVFEYGRQIRRIDDIEYVVLYQTWPDRAYAVFRTECGWICSCPDHLEAGHIYRVAIVRDHPVATLTDRARRRLM